MCDSGSMFVTEFDPWVVNCFAKLVTHWLMPLGLCERNVHVKEELQNLVKHMWLLKYDVFLIGDNDNRLRRGENMGARLRLAFAFGFHWDWHFWRQVESCFRMSLGEFWTFELKHIFLDLTTDSLGQRIQPWGWTLLFVTATHCRKWTSCISLSLLSRCQPQDPLDLIDLAQSLNLNIQHCVHVKSTESRLPRMQPSEELQVRSMQFKRKPGDGQGYFL